MHKYADFEEVFNRLVEVIVADFSDIALDVQLRFTSSGAIERLRIFLKMIVLWMYGYQHLENIPIIGNIDTSED